VTTHIGIPFDIFFSGVLFNTRHCSLCYESDFYWLKLECLNNPGFWICTVNAQALRRYGADSAPGIVGTGSEEERIVREPATCSDRRPADSGVHSMYALTRIEHR